MGYLWLWLSKCDPPHHPALIEMYRAYNNSDWVWAPYYSIHKQLAGLIDIATYMDDKSIADKALLIAKDMGLWVWNRMHYRTYVKKTEHKKNTGHIPAIVMKCGTCTLQVKWEVWENL